MSVRAFRTARDSRHRGAGHKSAVQPRGLVYAEDRNIPLF